MRHYTVKINGREFKVNLISNQNDKIEFEIDGKNYSTAISPIINLSTNNSQKDSSADHTSLANGQIKAPMPGIIVNVVAKEGSAIKKGETLLVIEAMKMENNLTAQKDGTIKTVHVKAGQEVQGGQLLITID